MKRFIAVLFVMVMIPYVTTLAWTGQGDTKDFMWENTGDTAGKTVVTEKNGKEYTVNAEEFLIGVLAGQIPAEYGEETLKAQAVLARTYIYREMDGADTIREEALDIDCLNRSQMEKKWGSSQFAAYYQKLKRAVQDTSGQILTYEGTPIEPLFCRAAAGKTRDGKEKYPYLRPVESAGDLEAEGFLELSSWTADQVAKSVNEIPDSIPVLAGQLPEEIQIVERDLSGYVLQIQIGQKTYSGEEIQYALKLPSSCYSFETYDGKIRISSKGIGHGYGFSQAGANALEREGYNYEKLLKYYFQNVELENRK